MTSLCRMWDASEQTSNSLLTVTAHCAHYRSLHGDAGLPFTDQPLTWHSITDCRKPRKSNLNQIGISGTKQAVSGGNTFRESKIGRGLRVVWGSVCLRGAHDAAVQGPPDDAEAARRATRHRLDHAVARDHPQDPTTAGSGGALPLGFPLGEVHDPDLQRSIIRALLALIGRDEMPVVVGFEPSHGVSSNASLAG